MRSWLTDRSHCHCTLSPSREVRASAIASPLRKLSSAPSRSPFWSRMSPMRSWLTDRSCCQIGVLRIELRQCLGDLQALAIALERGIEPPIGHVHVADAVAGHRQVAPEAGIAGLALQQRLHLALGLRVGRHRRIVVLARGMHVAQHGLAAIAQKACAVGGAELDLAAERALGRGKIAGCADAGRRRASAPRHRRAPDRRLAP